VLNVIGVVVVGRVGGVVVVALVQGGGILPRAISAGGHRRVGISRGSSYHGKGTVASGARGYGAGGKGDSSLGAIISPAGVAGGGGVGISADLRLQQRGVLYL